MTQLLYVVRHGQSTVNVERRLSGRSYEGGLTDLGRDQAHRAGQWLKDKDIGVIYASPFHRAQQTAEIMAGYLNRPVVTHKGLGEMDCGNLDGRMDQEGWDTFLAIYNRWIAGDLDARYPDGESLREGIERYRQVLQSACAENCNVLLVTHGGISRTAIPFLGGLANPAAAVNIQNTGMVILQPQPDDVYECRAWNLVEHLAES